MVALAGQLLREPGFGNVNPHLSVELGMLDPEGYATTLYDRPDLVGAQLIGRGFAAVAARVMASGALARSYHDDYYERIHVRPAILALGNLASSQVRQVYVWNAYTGQAHTMTDASLADGAGIELTLPDVLPLAFVPLQEREFELSIDSAGPPVIDDLLTFEFTGLDGITVRITGNRLVAWPLPADWGSDVDEELAWLTEVQESIDGQETGIPLRSAPRRTWAFDAIADRRERRIVENMLYDWRARVWALPVMPEVSWLPGELAAGAASIPVETAGIDFRAGGLAMLWSDVQRYELVEIDTVLPASLALARPTSSHWTFGTRLYPCRTARLVDTPQLRRKTDQLITTRVQFESDEPCDWPAIAPAAIYLGHPVLEHRADEAEDSTAAFDRVLVELDGDVGLMLYDDVTQLARPTQSHAWRLHGRAERAAHRSLLYWLEGRAQRLWLPTMADDLELVEATGTTGDTLTVAWAGIGGYLRLQPGRRHIRIELHTGVVYYRRVSGVEELDTQRERLLLDTPLGFQLAAGQVRQISWMALSRLAADRVRIAHVHDSEGIADVRTSFIAVPGEEP